MAYTQFDRFNKIVTPSDLQNKHLWCGKGERIEQAFVRNYGDQLDLHINPEKASNPYAPDLQKTNGNLADLKTQNTPFFKAGKLYGIDPSYAVVFNRKDYERYKKHYPLLEIYFWVEWHSVKFKMGSFVQTVEYINGVWSIPFTELVQVADRSPEHSYQQRVNDQLGNAKSSFVMDIRGKEFTKVI
jgi:hypothetical protein